MSRIHRIVEKAEREGLLTRTRSLPEDTPPAPPVERFEEPEPEPLHEVAPPQTGAAQAGEATEDELARVRSIHSAPAFVGIDPLLVVSAEPTSFAAEQFRLLRTRLSTRDKTRRTQTVLVTSPQNGDGKTITATNLALSMAQEFLGRVLLVEADLRRPSVGALLRLPASPGLADVLVGVASIEEALVPVPGQHLTVLAAGGHPARPTELMGSSVMRRTLEALRAQFDRIVIDTPPVVLADTHVLATLADAILLVVRAGVTPRPAVERALAAFDREKVLGLVLNDVEEQIDTYTYAAPYALASSE
jgi:protein-tyrosine kinase